MPDVDPIVQALMGVRQYPTDDPIAGIQPPLQMPKLGMTPPSVNAAPNPGQVMSGVGDLTGVNDAVRALRGQMTPEEQQAFAATAAFGLIPGAGELRPVAKAAEELAPPLYSAAAKAVQDARLTKGTPEQWLGYLRNQPGVKQEELTTMGALPSTNTGQLSKDEMQQWANANQVQLKEITKSGNPTLHDPQIARDMQTLRTHGINPVENPDVPGMVRFEAGHGDERDIVTSNEIDEHPDATQAARNIEAHMGGGTSAGNSTKFGQYQLPGGQNYREMLMMLPTNMPGEYSPKLSRQGFKSPHWDEPNVVAHARMNDRDVPDANGDPKKTLFLEELQSDWHQAGRKLGYQDNSPLNAEARPAANGDGWAVFDKDNGRQISAGAMGQNDATNLAQEWVSSRIKNGLGVPDAPFKQTWPDLMLKRLVRHAAENGYDQLAWTPGDVQADRYDLSDAFDRVTYNSQSNELRAWKKGNIYRPDIEKTATPDQLPDYIGKEGTQKLLATTPDYPIPDTEGVKIHDLRGTDLKVGGEGMRAFYDKMLVDRANAIGKKYGAKVIQSPLPVGTAGQPIASGYIGDPKPAQAHVLPITSELKHAALTKGFPMFAAGGLTALGAADGQTGGASQDENQQMLSALRGSPPTPQQ